MLPILVAAPDAFWQFNRLFVYSAQTCAEIRHWDVLPLPPGPSNFPTGVELNGRREVVAAVLEPSEQTVFYNLGAPAFAQTTLSSFTASAPGEDGIDIALGSNF
jgi:hypothetical protein